MTEAAVQERPITSRQIMVGDVPIGGGAQVAVQSMTNTNTSDVETTVQQVYDLNAAGADLVRVSVNGSKALAGFKEVVWRSPVPLIADVHFDYRMALGAADAGAACVRINPGNIGSDDRYRQVIESACRREPPCALASTPAPWRSGTGTCLRPKHSSPARCKRSRSPKTWALRTSRCRSRRATSPRWSRRTGSSASTPTPRFTSASPRPGRSCPAP
jgi:hypothetical protein